MTTETVLHVFHLQIAKFEVVWGADHRFMKSLGRYISKSPVVERVEWKDKSGRLLGRFRNGEDEQASLESPHNR